MRAVLVGLGLLLLSGLLAIVAAIVAAIGSGPTVAAGERAVTAIGVFDLGLWLAGCIAFGYATRPLPTARRWIARIGFGLLDALWLAAWLLLTVVMFNR
jgi:hypothetical protein